MATSHIVDVQIRMMQVLSGELRGVGGQMTGLQGQADSLGKTMKAAFAFHELERFGQAGKDAFGGMIQQASNLQLAMSKVQIATSASGKEMKTLGNLITETSSKHAMSAMQAADMMAVVARTGMEKETIKSTFGSISTFADIQKMERGMEFEQSAKLAATTARFFGARDPASTEKVLNNLYRAMNTSPMAPNQLLTSLQNFAPVGQQLGMSQEEVFQAASLMGTMGLGSKGGTGMFNILLRSIGKTPSMTGHRESEQVKALRDLGLTQEKIAPGGKFNFEALFSQLTAKEKEFGAKGESGRFVKDLMGAFNDRGGKVAAALSTPEAQANMEEMIRGWGKITTMQGAYEIEQKNLAYQSGVLTTNLQNLSATAGKLSAESMVPFKAKMADVIAGLDSYLKSSPVLGKDVGRAVQLGMGASTALEAVGKVGSAAAGLMSLRGLFTGAGARVWVTNMPGGGLGGGGGVGGALGNAGKLIGAATAGYAAGTLIDQLFTYSAGKSIGEADYNLLFGRADKHAEDKAQRSQAEKTHAMVAADDAKHGVVHFHGATFHIHDVNDVAKLSREIRKAISRGATTTSPGGKPGGATGP